MIQQNEITLRLYFNKVLNMDDTSVTDEAIAKFARFKALDEISILRTKLSDEGRKKLCALGLQHGGEEGRPNHRSLKYVPRNLGMPWGDYLFPYEFETVDIPSD